MKKNVEKMVKNFLKTEQENFAEEGSCIEMLNELTEDEIRNAIGIEYNGQVFHKGYVVMWSESKIDRKIAEGKFDEINWDFYREFATEKRYNNTVQWVLEQKLGRAVVCAKDDKVESEYWKWYRNGKNVRDGEELLKRIEDKLKK